VCAEQNYLAEKLASLTAAVQHHRPVDLVGASGTFDTLGDLQAARAGQPRSGQPLPPETEITLDSFYQSYNLLLTLDRTGRLALPGMTPLRADMIVVACVLIDFVLKTYGFTHIRASAFALKEGLLSEMLRS
jgi:exopolyphosphatase/guanosine-5'-triphosphate,3'-diphosphate pyrophosphatase